jgi:formate-dependent nitrite reductase membrane component NrfD
VSRWLSDRPWFALILWFLGIGAMASVSWWLLRRRAQQRLKSATPHTDG